MFRLILISVFIGIALSSPIEVKKLKSRKIYSINGIVGGEQSTQNTIPIEQPKEVDHVRYAPQDPFATADENFDGTTRSEQSIVPEEHHRQHQPSIHQQFGPSIRTTTTPKTISSSGISYDDLNKHQAQNAHYQFNAAIHDDINDHSHTRSEERDGSKVTGMYSYSDGFFHRTVHYVADENGYRVVKEHTEKIGEGPQFNAEGVADVKGSLIGDGYSIKIDDRERNPHYVGTNRSK